MRSKEIMELDRQYVMQTYARFDLAIDKGQGATLYSPEGKKYIDFTSGIGVNSLGYGNESWQKAICEQAGKLGHISNLYYSEPYVRLAQTLCLRSGMDKAFFCNSGAEANEGAIKLARKYSFDKYGDGRSTVMSLFSSFHGRTITTLAATGQERLHNYFFPFTEGFRYVKAGDIEALKAEAGDDVCAVMLELIQGEGGVNPLDKDYVLQVQELCRENDWLLIIDEVQTGIGRTGSLFASAHYGLSPDVISFAKGIAGGLPLGGMLAAKSCSEVLTAGTHATTFGGNPINCAAALAVLETLSDSELEKVNEKGRYIKDFVLGLNSPKLTEIRGLGLMLGIELKVSHKELAAKLVDEGLLCLTAGENVLRLLPPLTISYEEIDEGLAILKSALS